MLGWGVVVSGCGAVGVGVGVLLEDESFGLCVWFLTVGGFCGSLGVRQPWGLVRLERHDEVVRSDRSVGR